MTATMSVGSLWTTIVQVFMQLVFEDFSIKEQLLRLLPLRGVDIDNALKELAEKCTYGNARTYRQGSCQWEHGRLRETLSSNIKNLCLIQRCVDTM